MRGKYYFYIFCSLLLAASCGFFAASVKAGKAEVLALAEEEANPPEFSGYIVRSSLSEGAIPSGSAFMILNIEKDEDLIIAAYRNKALQKQVVAFFEGITGSEETASLILFYSSINNVPPALAFSLCAEESSYNQRAYNRNQNETVDRGLFQLNSASFPKLSVEDFYNPAINVRYGIAHLRWCLDIAGTDVAALAMYNAGETRVRSNGAPKKTLDYISRILNRQRRIEGLFMAEVILGQLESIENERVEVEIEEKTPFRLNLLTPLGGRSK